MGFIYVKTKLTTWKSHLNNRQMLMFYIIVVTVRNRVQGVRDGIFCYPWASRCSERICAHRNKFFIYKGGKNSVKILKIKGNLLFDIRRWQQSYIYKERKCERSVMTKFHAHFFFIYRLSNYTISSTDY